MFNIFEGVNVFVKVIAFSIDLLCSRSDNTIYPIAGLLCTRDKQTNCNQTDNYSAGVNKSV